MEQIVQDEVIIGEFEKDYSTGSLLFSAHKRMRTWLFRIHQCAVSSSRSHNYAKLNAGRLHWKGDHVPIDNHYLIKILALESIPHAF